MEGRRTWLLMWIAALCLVLAVPCVEAEDQSVPVQNVPPSGARRPLTVDPSIWSAETQPVPVQAVPSSTPTSGARQPLVSPNISGDTQPEPVQSTSPSGARRPLVSPNLSGDTQPVPVQSTPPSGARRPLTVDPGIRSAETQPVPVQAVPSSTPPSETRRPLVSPNISGDTQPVPVQSTPPSGARRPLASPNLSGDTQPVPVQSTPPSRVRRPLTGPDSNAETQRVQTGGTPQATQTPGEQPGFTERHGAAVLTVLLTTEQIIRCQNEGLSSGECACRLLEQAAVGTGITLGAMLTGTVPVLVAVGAATMTVKGFQDSVEIMYEGGSLVQALIEEERIERERERQQEINRPRLAEMLDKERIRTLNLLEGHATSLAGICSGLEGIASDAERDATLAQEELAAMAGPALAARVEEMARSCSNIEASSARVASIRDRVTGYASQIREALERLSGQCRSCATREEAERIREGYDACAGLMRGIRQLNAEALQKAEEIRGIQSNAALVRSFVDTARTSKDRIAVLAGQAVGRSGVFETDVQRAMDGANGLESACAASDRNMANLREAFGELGPEETARFEELKELVARYRGRACSHEAFKSRYDNAQDKAVYAKLHSENLMRSLEESAAALGACESVSTDHLLTDIAAAEQDAAIALSAHGDLPAMANECARRSGAAEIASEGGENSGGFSSQGGETHQAAADDGGDSPAPGGFSSAGGKTVALAEKPEPGASPQQIPPFQDPVRPFFESPSGAAPGADPGWRNSQPETVADHYAAEEARRQAEAAQRADQERQQAAVGLLGAMATMQQNLDHIRSSGQTPVQNPPPAVMPNITGFSPSQQSMVDQGRPAPFSGNSAPRPNFSQNQISPGVHAGSPALSGTSRPNSCDPSIDNILRLRDWEFIANRAQQGGPWLPPAGRPSVLGKYREVSCGAKEARYKFRCIYNGEIRCLE